MATNGKTELIEDREVATFDDDRLGHRQIADELAALVQTIPTPSNVALYGSWGSGKSGIGNMLAERLEVASGVKFARFDAFKYAENPLRRNFISVVANALDIQSAKYHADLYRGRSSTDFSVPPKKIGQLLGIFALVVFVCVLAVSAAVGIVAALQGKAPFDAILALGVNALPASLVPASLLTAVIALVGKTFVVEKRVERADSDEEFERLLQDLVDQSRADRVVIFVDELDRCSPSDVVETLNAVRTFLGVKKCVFVVAADQQVLEEALTKSSDQATPVDAVNPYYSAGSAYLDKVFQYQISVPPLMSQSITSFAVGLAAGRPGVWESVDVGLICSILIPAHVRSPRRVKNLLNAFVIAYRLADARHTSGQLDVELDACVDELARLICLRVEFPLFARDLVTDPRLGDYVLALSEAEDSEIEGVWAGFPFVDDRVKEIAHGYANASRSVDRLLVEGDDNASRKEVAKVQKMQGEQLLDYLTRTRLVTGPTKALIYLQNSGPVFGLSALVAEKLELDAQNAAIANLRGTFAGLDADEKEAAVDLLVQQARAVIGLEVPNVVSSILALLADPSVSLETRADSIGVVVTETITSHPEILTDSTSAGAWRLALAGTRAEAESLGSMVLDGPHFLDGDELFQSVLGQGPIALRMNRSRVTSVLLERLFDRPEETVDVLLSLQEQAASAVIESVAGDLTSRLKAELVANAAAATAAEAAAAARLAAPPVASAAVASPEGDEAQLYDTELLLEQLARLTGGLPKAVAEMLLTALLKVNRVEVRNVVEDILAPVGPVDGSDLSRQILSNVAPRALSLWPRWLNVLDPVKVAQLKDVSKALKPAVDRLWSQALDDALSADVIRNAATSLAASLDSLGTDALESVQAQVERVGPAVESAADIPSRDRFLEVSQIISASGLSRGAEMNRKDAVALGDVLEMDIAVEAVESPLVEFTLVALDRVLQYRDADGAALSSALQEDLVDSLAASTWLSEVDAARAAVLVAARVESDVALEPLTIPKAATIGGYKADLSITAFDRLVSDWLIKTSEPAANVTRLIAPLLVETATDRLISAVRTWRTGLKAEDRSALVSRYVAAPRTPLSPVNVLEAIGLADLPESEVATMLISRFRAETSNSERQTVLELWGRAHLTEAAQRKRLVRDVLVPMFGLNTQASRTAIPYLVRLADPIPTGLRKPLAEAVVEATEGQGSLENRARDGLAALGFKVESKGLFGWRKKVDTSS